MSIVDEVIGEDGYKYFPDVSPGDEYLLLHAMHRRLANKLLDWPVDEPMDRAKVKLARINDAISVWRQVQFVKNGGTIVDPVDDDLEAA